MRLLATPFALPAAWPGQRPGGLDARLRPSLIPAPGLERLRPEVERPNLLAVTSGQQPALFTGPLYTVHKALSAAALARALSAKWGRPVLPLFWVASDDHDYAEANHAAWLRMDGSLHLETLPPRPAEHALRPMAREPLDGAIEAALAALGADLASLTDPGPTLEWLRGHFQAGRTLGAASGGALAELLAPFGIACVDGASPALKREAAPIIRRALEEAGPLDAALARRAADLRGAGRDAGIAAGDGATLVMLETEQGRDRLVREGDGFVTRHGRRRWPAAELYRLLEREPERFSANVLLRPVVEAALLPTVAYVAGPGELRYLALAEVVYEALGVTPQLPVPRWSGLMVEPRVDRVLDKFAATVDELLAPGVALETRVARTHLPDEATRALGELRATLTKEYGILGDAAAAVDPTLTRMMEGLRGRALAGADRAERKLIQHLRRRMEAEREQIARARTAVLPGGKPQERVLTIAPFLARYGRGILDALLAEMEAWYAAALEGRGAPS